MVIVSEDVTKNVDQNPVSISVFFPCYNEQENVGAMTEKLTEIMNTSLPQYDYEIIFDDDSCKVVDLESTGGTYLNGTKVNEDKMSDGDILNFAKVHEYKITIPSDNDVNFVMLSGKPGEIYIFNKGAVFSKCRIFELPNKKSIYFSYENGISVISWEKGFEILGSTVSVKTPYGVITLKR